MQPTYGQQYLCVTLLAGVAVVAAIAPLILARFLAPKKPSACKTAPYECGLPSSGDAWAQFRVQYSIYALLFVIFDVEIVFLYPWALVWTSLGAVALVEMGLFLLILAVALAYAWRTGVLEWE